MKKATCKNNKVRKILVRNSITPAKSYEVIGGKKRVQFADITEEVEEEKRSQLEQKDFMTPEFLSILKLADEIKKIELPCHANVKKKDVKKKCKSYNVNFKPDERLYQDLIRLEVANDDLHPKMKSISSARSNHKRDAEPDFKELSKYTLQPGYIFTEFIIPEVKKSKPYFDGHSIYNLSKQWNIDATC